MGDPLALSENATCACCTKFLPKTLRVVCGLPAGTVVGESDVIVGAGKLIVCWHEDITSITNIKKQKVSRDFSSKILTPMQYVDA